MFISLFGWYGTAAILVAYVLTAFSVLPPTHVGIIVLNATGALGIGAVSLKRKAWQPALLNSVWFVVAVSAVVRTLF